MLYWKKSLRLLCRRLLFLYLSFFFFLYQTAENVGENQQFEKHSQGEITFKNFDPINPDTNIIISTSIITIKKERNSIVSHTTPYSLRYINYDWVVGSIFIAYPIIFNLCNI